MSGDAAATWRVLAAPALLLSALLASSAAAGGFGGSALDGSHPARPEIRSHQPYSGLQYGFRPEPLRDHTMRRAPDAIIMPEPVSPLIEYGKTTRPHTGQYYAY